MRKILIKPQNCQPLKYRAINGQAMLFTVMVLTGVIVMLALMVGMLMIFGLRHVADAQATGDAIFAADTGIECAIMNEFVVFSPTVIANLGNVCVCTEGENRQCEGRLDNQSVFRATRRTEAGMIIWTSVGRDIKERTARSLEIQFREF